MDTAHTLYEKFVGSKNPELIIITAHEIKKHFSNVLEKEPTDEIGEELLYLLGGKEETFEWQLFLSILFLNDESFGEYLATLKNKINQISSKQNEWANLILSKMYPEIKNEYVDKFSNIIELLDKMKSDSNIEKEKNIEKIDKKNGFWKKLFGKNREFKTSSKSYKKDKNVVGENLSKPVKIQSDKVHFSCLVDFDAVKSGDISLILNAAYDAVEKYKKTKILTPFMFGIHGYDDISKPLCALPEVRTWSAKLYREIPSIFGLIDYPAIYWFLPCIANIEIVNEGSSQTQIRWPVDLADLINEICTKTEKHFHKISSTQEEVNQLYNEFFGRIQTAAKKLGL